MDGVLANLYDYITERVFQKKFVDLSKEEDEILRKIFRDREYFRIHFPEGCECVFENLEPFPFNKTLIETVMCFGGEYTILSRPSRLDIEGSKRAKIKWVEKHLSFCPPKEILLVQDKSANGRAKDNVLIDDWNEFLERWEQKEGFPIKFKAVDYKTKDEVRDYLNEKLINIFHGFYKDW